MSKNVWWQLFVCQEDCLLNYFLACCHACVFFVVVGKYDIAITHGVGVFCIGLWME